MGMRRGHWRARLRQRYPMAWFFNMITSRSVPHALASAVIEDAQAGFNYLPDRDAEVVKAWLFRPYGF